MAKPYGNETEDKWFHWKGAKPPERNAHLTEDELRKILDDQKSKATCRFIQQGNLISCDEHDNFSHGKRIRPDQRLISPDGTLGKMEPVLRKAAAR